MRRTLIFSMIAFAFILPITLAQSVHAASDPDLVALWTFDEGGGTEVKDSSENGNDGKASGDVEWVDGKFGTALKFDGNLALVTIPHSESLDFGDDFSVTLWVKTTQAKANLGAWWNGGWIINKDMPGQADATDWDIANVNGHLVLVTGNPDKDVDDLLVSTDPINDGQWHHIAVTRERESGLKTIYVDSIKDVSEEHGPGFAVSNETDMTIGGHPNGPAHALDGVLDDMAIYSRILSEAEIQSIMESGALSVETVGKLATTWGRLRISR